jgi:ArsR family transcriptional regulator, arsenate/arsenite/antimonite-responsive transcriptional repressor
MEMSSAIDAFQALGNELRLSIYQLLMREGPDGLSAGEIARRLSVSPSTLSQHLHALRRAGLLISSRQQQRIIYAVDIEGTRRLLLFLTRDCCRGRPEICEGLFEVGMLTTR